MVSDDPESFADLDGHKCDDNTGKGCFWEKLQNKWNYDAFVTNKNLESALQKDADAARRELTNSNVQHDGQNPDEYLKGKSNKEVLDLWHEFMSYKKGAKIPWGKQMRMNQRMSALLRQADIPVPFVDDPGLGILSTPALSEVGEFFLLKNQYEANKHVSPADLPDKTGYECFINHVHRPFDGTGASLKSCLSYAIALQKGLARIETKNRNFQVIVSVDDHECTIRFHQLRQGESWVAEDLEGYAEEAILLLTTDQTTGRVPLAGGSP